MTDYYFVNPTESLFVRGNLAFGDGGEHGAGMMPPPPSLFAGAFRSAILGRDPDALSRFLREGRAGEANLDAALGAFDPSTGLPVSPGQFRLGWVSLAGQSKVGESDAEGILPLPADLMRLESGLCRLTPGDPSGLVATGHPLPMVAMMRAGKQEKPQAGSYLREAGFSEHLAARLPNTTHCVESKTIHVRDPRLGIGLDTESRSIESGLIYTTEGFAFNPPGSPFSATGFLVGIDGAEGLLPETGFLRLGGDGRSASYRRVHWRPPSQAPETLGQTGRFRLILQTHGLFERGWLPAGVTKDGDDFVLKTQGFEARLVCAAVSRREVVSGWNLLGWRPKDAQRVAPAGSVYWFDRFTGSPGKLAEWAAGGLWGETVDVARRAEGYNRALVGNWI